MTTPDSAGGGAVTGAQSTDGSSAVHLIPLAMTVLRYRYTVLAAALSFILVTAGLTLTRERTYTSRSSFVPQARQARTSLSTLAAQFGFSVPTDDATQTPDFYSDVLRSRGILTALATATYDFRLNGRSMRGTLVDAYRIKEKNADLAVKRAVERLNSDISTTLMQRTGVLRVGVQAPAPELALTINEHLLREINRFNLETRRSQAAAEREFAESRLAEVKRDLRAAEDRVAQFLQRNREFRKSPPLSFEHDRLERDVAVQQQLYTVLSEAFEQAKLEEIRNTPVITVLERPDTPLRPDRRGLITRSFLALILGTLAGLLLAFWRQSLEPARTSAHPLYHDFVALRRQAWNELRRPQSIVIRVFSARRKHYVPAGDGRADDGHNQV